MEFKKNEHFEIELYEPEGGANLGKVNRSTVTITNDKCKFDIYLIRIQGILVFKLFYIFLEH